MDKKLVADFFKLANEFEKSKDSKLNPGSYLYEKVLEYHKKDYPALVKDDKFLSLVYITLIAFGMNRGRGVGKKSKKRGLKDFKEFKDSVSENKNRLIKLHKKTLGKLSNDYLLKILNVFSKLKVMKSKSKLVGWSKALHFLLPTLVMPVDKTFTVPFFSRKNMKHSNKCQRKYKEFRIQLIALYKGSREEVKNLSEKKGKKLWSRRDVNTFARYLITFRNIAKEFRLEQEVKRRKISTKIPKLIDNALIIYDNLKKEK